MRTMLVVSIFSFLCMPADADSVSFFGGTDLDYWRSGPKVLGAQKTPAPKKTPMPKVGIREHDSEPFDWDDYSGPESDVFWDDGGSYIPPRPFRILAAHPTSENKKRYVEWMAKKIEISRKIAFELAAEAPPFQGTLANTSDEVEKSVQERLQRQQAAQRQPQESKVVWDEVSVIFFYSSSCPHCRSALATVRDLARRGAKVIPVQLDAGKSEPLVPGSVPYSPEMAAAFPVKSTPTWVLSRRGHNATAEGALSVAALAQVVPN